MTFKQYLIEADTKPLYSLHDKIMFHPSRMGTYNQAHYEQMLKMLWDLHSRVEKAVGTIPKNQREMLIYKDPDDNEPTLVTTMDKELAKALQHLHAAQKDESESRDVDADAALSTLHAVIDRLDGIDEVIAWDAGNMMDPVKYTG